ncbi:hypothetical protein [Desulfonema magnum]|uniref:Uncharacterized protein n=2 Tax=Desulfonema magnum TaxID=45655 RepID=A0A975GMS1_9BACT|nr:hypothetical protein [Desulfonema magnum]QTA85701.1 Uncharacterized protein dnm_017150 [Desulfonema magnum]QTA86083.1 Uncharacterized protein dnm_021010 [Desulfonema magnum]QTA86164.1 Uncharacterized protein dnm_021850 [Desulfonema magnum]QTA86519.1 Uncharacterized protein dnm_025430 [Desulfonema magnum]QTA86676.1 Uncharacterized protein dnm_027000 [Desulfonema magnum]
MTTKTAEEHFTEEMLRAAEEFGKILRPYFRRMPDEDMETLLLISMAVFLGADNVYQVMQVLGLPKTATYDRVKNVSVYCWRKFLQNHLYSIAVPLLRERLTMSDATKSRDGLIMAVDDSVIARIATELGYVWKWWSGQLKRVANGQNVIALILVIGDIILPLDVRIVSKQGRGLKTKPEIYEEMLKAAEAKFEAAGIDISRLGTTGDAAYFSQDIAAFCRGECSEEASSESDASATDTGLANEDAESSDPALLLTLTGIFRGKDNYVFEIDGEIRKAGQWRKNFKDRLTPGWGTDGQPVYRTEAVSETFGEVILVFYIPKGKRAVSYLIIAGRPLRSSEALHAFAFHHRIEEFRKLLKDTLELGAMHLRDRKGAHACVGVKVIAYLVVNMMKQNLRKLRRFRNVTINKLVRLCPKFVDVRKIFKEHFQSIIPNNHTLDKALA